MKFLKLFLTAVVSFLIPSVAAQQRSSASHLGTVNAPLSAKSISITGLAEMYEPDFMGSSASGDGFSYHDIWPDVGWWATCIIGQPCQVPSVRLSTEWPDQQGGESACFDTCTSFRTGEIDFGEPFITPATNSHVSVQVPVTVYGSVTGYYSTDEFSPNGWPLWTVTFRGKGTANVSLVYWSENTLVIDSFSVRYTAAGKGVDQVLTSGTPGEQPTGLTYNSGYFYESEQGAFGTINQRGGGFLSFLSPSAGGFDGRSSPSDLTSFGTHLFMTDVGTQGAGAVYEFDVFGTRIFNSFAVPFRGGAIAADRKRLFIGDLDSKQILVTNHAGKPIRSLATSFQPAGMVFDATDNLLWIIDQAQGFTISQATTKGAPIRSCSGPWNPSGPASGVNGPVPGLGAVSKNGSKLYVAEVGGYELWSEPGTVSIVDAQKLSCTPALPTRVRLAGLFPSIVNVNSGGVIQTAVLSSSKFDATKIDPATILFGDTGTEAPPANWSLLDVDGDGQLDLQLVFNVQQTGIACDTTLMSLTGKLLTGTQVRGTTAIKTSGC